MAKCLTDYLKDDDSQKWWRLSSGEMESLFDEAMLVIDKQNDKISTLENRVELLTESW